MAEDESQAAPPLALGDMSNGRTSPVQEQEIGSLRGQRNDSAVTRAEKVERDGYTSDDLNDRPAKKIKIEEPPRKGVAPIKAEYLVHAEPNTSVGDDRNGPPAEERNDTANGEKSSKKKSKGQNTNRKFGSSRDAIALCLSRASVNEFAPLNCSYGSDCKYEHDLRKYLKDGKREDLTTFNSKCPVFEARGECNAGWRCRFAGSHSEERELEDGRKEMVLLGNSAPTDDKGKKVQDEEVGVFNIVSAEAKIKLKKRQIGMPKSEAYTKWLNSLGTGWEGNEQEADEQTNGAEAVQNEQDVDESRDNRAQYKEPPLLPSEKRRIYYGPETPILAPLTTQGNLPFRRLCVNLGAQVTWSEMAMGLPLVQGEKPEWALMKVHESEMTPPLYRPLQRVVDSYDNSKDLKFGAQIAGNKPWIALKTTEILTDLCPHLRAVDLNCGCPIDLVYRQGAGSALLDSPGKLEKILRGMNAVSGEVPVTVKIRMGTRDNKPTATRLVSRLTFGSEEQRDLGPSGVAAIALHGRSRQQRYTRSADWQYIAQCAAVIQSYRSQRDALVDTVRSPDPRNLPSSNSGNVYFVGNGDVFSHTDYFDHLNQPVAPAQGESGPTAAVDAVMVARGALIKPWIFEEIAKGQHLDKTSSERLRYIEDFARYGLETWGSDEIGVGTTRRFLLEWLSFACRYVPIGMLERLPPRIQDRPPAFKGRDELETLLSSDNYRDWIKISEMFLGPAHKDFRFEPKHKSNMTAEG